MAAPADVYAHALDLGVDLVARDRDGSTRVMAVGTWLAPADDADDRVLARARGPVLDVGCGPGRHVHALARRGVLAVGVDVTPAAVRVARAGGATVHQGSIFDRLPGGHRWQTALLLDGNIGIGGCPAGLLRRLATLLAPGGQVLVELEAPGSGLEQVEIRLEDALHTSRWFPWARVGWDAIDAPAGAAELHVAERWRDGGRWFAALAA